MPLATSTIREISLEEAEHHVSGSSVYVDLKPVDEYLDVHVPGSLSLEYEFGPGMPSRARDCIPLDVGFVLLDHGGLDMTAVAAGLRGKGFTVHGYLRDGLRTWAEAEGTPASSEVVETPEPPEGTLLSVGDPGSVLPEGSLYIPIERLWQRIDEVQGDPVVIIAGRGIRAALAIGMFERMTDRQLLFWRRRA
jgi:rhodanese-related sulfurtransferase